MLAGDLAETAMGGDLPRVVTDALAVRGWRPARDRSLLPVSGEDTVLVRRVRVAGDLFHGRVPPGAVYVSRATPGLPASPYANPHRVGRCRACDLVHDRVGAVAAYARHLADRLSVVTSDIFGVSGRDMLAALAAGERDPKVLAQFARTRMRGKISDLEEAFTGYFTDHHAWLLTKMLARIDQITADITELEDKIADQIAPFAQAVDSLDEIPGVGRVAAHVIIAEIGIDMTRFPTPGHLASWARFSPGIKESAGKKKGTGSTGHGNPYLARVLGEAAVSAGKTDTFLGERYRRIAWRRGRKKAVVAVGRSILVIVWHLLNEPTTRFIDLGPDFYDTRTGPQRKTRNHVRQLEARGYKVTLEPAA